MPILIADEFHNFLSWNISEATTPTAPGGQIAGTGSASFSVMFTDISKPLNANNLYQTVDDVEFIQGEAASIALSRASSGLVQGFVDNATFNGSEGMQTAASFDIITFMNQLSVVRDLPPILESSLEDVFDAYLRTVFPQFSFLDYQGSDQNIYSFIGWTGDVWQALCSLAAMTGMEIVFDNELFIVRDIGQNVIDFSNRTAPTQRFRSNNLGRYVDVTYQNQTVISTILAARENLSPNPSVEVADTGWIEGIISHPNVTTNGGRTNLWASNGSYSFMAEYDCSDHVTTPETARIYSPVVQIQPGKSFFVSMAANMLTDNPSRFTPTGNYTLRVRGFDSVGNQVGPNVAETYPLGTRGGFSYIFPMNVTQIQADVSKEWVWDN